MKKFILLFIAAALAFICVYYRSKYSIILLTLFSLENLYFANYAYKYVIYRKQDVYHSIRFEYEHGKPSSMFEIWMDINDVLAYKKLYLLCLRKKTNLISLFSCFITIMLGVPLKLINFLIFFWKKNGNLKSNLLEYFYINYNSVDGKKIEFINKTVYLNCSTRQDVLKKIISLNKEKTPEQTCEIYKKLIKLSFDGKHKDNRRTTEFKLGFLETEKGIKVKKQHWSHVSNEKLNGDSVKMVTHATSSIPNQLTDTQFSGIAMLNLIKKGSPKPGSVWTMGNFRYKALDTSASRYIPSWQFEYTKYDVFRLMWPTDNTNVFFDTEGEISTILGAEPTDPVVKAFAAGHHDLVLLADFTVFDEKNVLADVIQIKNDFHI